MFPQMRLDAEVIETLLDIEQEVRAMVISTLPSKNWLGLFAEGLRPQRAA